VLFILYTPTITQDECNFVIETLSGYSLKRDRRLSYCLCAAKHKAERLAKVMAKRPLIKPPR
jgi:stage III sporulation protein SpoIIIAA